MVFVRSVIQFVPKFFLTIINPYSLISYFYKINFGRFFFYSPLNKLLMSTGKKEMWGRIINVVLAILSAVATTLGLNSCMGF